MSMKITPGKLVLATGNRDKVLEFQSMLSPVGFTLLTPKEIGFTREIEETGTTFAANALIKAQALATATAYPILADDSGLEVDALDGAPGVYSARFASESERSQQSGPMLSQAAANRAKLIQNMKGIANRQARFRCMLCYLAPGLEPQFFPGICEGQIAESERGNGGFGYDSLFIPAGYNLTFGELSQELKDRLSHRALAVADFLKSVSVNKPAQ